MVTGRDITEHKRAEQALQVALTKYKTLFDSFPLGITVADTTGAIIETNSTATTLLGTLGTEHLRRVLGEAAGRIVRKDGTPMPAAEFPSVQALLTAAGLHQAELGLIHPNEQTVWMNVIAAPLPPPVGGVVVSYGDITELVNAEAALREADRRKDEFLAMLAHELRNPLTPVVTAVALLKRAGLNDAQIAPDVICGNSSF